MKKLLALAAIAAATIATPASAQWRAEARGGLAFGGGVSDAVIGAAAGYDVNVANSDMFFGGELSLDKTLVDGSDVTWGVAGRYGKHFTETTRGYALAGVQLGGNDSFNAGVGFEKEMGNNNYFKAEYRHYFLGGADSNTIMGGVGIRF